MSMLCQEIDCINASPQTTKSRWQPEATEGFRRSDIFLLNLCIPFVIFGILTNVLVLWIWSTLTNHFCHTVYLFKTMALADMFYLGCFLPVRFFVSRDVHGDLFLRILTYGNQVVGIYVSLMLAIVRSIRVFFPDLYRRCLSPFHVKMLVAVNLLCSLTVQALYSSSYIFLKDEHDSYWKPILKEGLLMCLPALLQTVLMMMVLLKLRYAPRSKAPNIPMVNEVQALADKDHPEQLGMSYSLQLETSDALSEDPQSDHASWSEEGAAHFGPRAARPADAPKDSTRPTPEAQRGGVGFFQAPVSSEQCGDTDVDRPRAAGQERKAEPMSCSLELTDTFPPKDTIRKSSLRKSTPMKSSRAIGEVSERRRVSFATESGTLIKPFETKLIESDARTAYVVFAICFSTFLVYPVCVVVKAAFKSASLHYACYVLALLHSGVKFFFYLFIDCFRTTLNTRKGNYMPKVRPQSS